MHTAAIKSRESSQSRSQFADFANEAVAFLFGFIEFQLPPIFKASHLGRLLCTQSHGSAMICNSLSVVRSKSITQFNRLTLNCVTSHLPVRIKSLDCRTVISGSGKDNALKPRELTRTSILLMVDLGFTQVHSCSALENRS